jgi:hypothetical protein
MIGTKVAQSLLHSVLNCCKIAITLIFLGPTENSVPINQHPCGTLIADLVDALSLLASTSEFKGAGSLRLVQASSASRCREFLSRKNPVLISKSLVADQGEASFPLSKANIDATDLLRLSSASLISVV